MSWLSSDSMPPLTDTHTPDLQSNIAVIGAGYVGLVTAAGFANLGHRIRLADRDGDAIAALARGEVRILEPGLSEILAAARDSGRIEFFTDNIEAVGGADVVFLAVPTPEGSGGQVDLTFVEAALTEIGAVVSAPTPVVVKSTVPPGTPGRLLRALTAAGSNSPLVLNPEFLQEGRAIEDVMHPHRIVVGSADRDAAALVAGLHEPLGVPMIITDLESAALTKYAANAYLATRLTFANAIAHFAESVGADVSDVIAGLSPDPRIGGHYLQPGPGYGGSCFPKDVRALVAAGDSLGHDLKLFRAVVSTNDDQLDRVVAKVSGAVGPLEGKVIGLLGLAFKAGTGDTRSSPAVALAIRIVAAGATVRAYDPAAEVDIDGIEIVDDPIEAARGADGLLVATEWPEFAEIDPARFAAVMRGRSVIDARNLLDRDAVVAAGLEYQGLGR